MGRCPSERVIFEGLFLNNMAFNQLSSISCHTNQLPPTNCHQPPTQTFPLAKLLTCGVIRSYDSRYINGIFLPKVQVRRKCKLEKDGLWIQPGNYTLQTLKAYDEKIGEIKFQQLPSGNSIQMEDKSGVLHDQEKISLYSEALLDQVSTCLKRRMT